MKKAAFILIMFSGLLFLGHNQAFAIFIGFDLNITGTLTGTDLGDWGSGEIYSLFRLDDMSTFTIIDKWEGKQSITGPGDISIPIDLSHSWSGDLKICDPFGVWWYIDAVGGLKEGEISWDVTGQLTITGPLEWIWKLHSAYAHVDDNLGSDENKMEDPSHAFANATWNLSWTSSESKLGEMTSKGYITRHPSADGSWGNSQPAFSREFHPIPEPSTLFLLGAGLLGFVGYSKVKANRKKKY